MSLETLISQLPHERKQEKRVLTLLLCGDDASAADALFDSISTPGLSPTTKVESAAEVPSESIDSEDDPEDDEETLGGFKMPGLVKTARNALGGLGSTLSDLNSNFANSLGLIDTELGQEAAGGRGSSVGLRVRACLVQSPGAGKQQSWRVLVVRLMAPVPTYRGWKKLVLCVCAPKRFPNIMVWYCRTEQSMRAQTVDERDAGKVLPRLMRHVPVIRCLLTPQGDVLELWTTSTSRARQSSSHAKKCPAVPRSEATVKEDVL